MNIRKNGARRERTLVMGTAIERGVLVQEYLDPGATWNGEQRCRLRDITKVEFGGAYERALAEVAEACARGARP